MKINTLEEAEQYAFNKAVRGLNSQEWQKCIAPDEDESEAESSCVFNKGVPGFHCAIGWLIPEDKQGGLRHDESALEIKMLGIFDPPLQEWLDSCKGNDFLCEHLLRDMMLAHDRNDGRDMYQQFLSLARIHDLTWPKDVGLPV